MPGPTGAWTRMGAATSRKRIIARMNTDEHGSKRESYLCSSVFIRGSKSVFPERRAAMKPHRVLILGLLAAMLAAAQSGRRASGAGDIQDAMLATTTARTQPRRWTPNSGRARRRSMRTRRPSHRTEPAGPGKTERRGSQETSKGSRRRYHRAQRQDRPGRCRSRQGTEEDAGRTGQEDGSCDRGVRNQHGLRDGVRYQHIAAPLLYAENATDITSEVIAAYETRHKSAER